MKEEVEEGRRYPIKYEGEEKELNTTDGETEFSLIHS